MAFWVNQFGNYRLTDIDTPLIRKHIKAYHEGKCVRGHGRKGDTIEMENFRKPATVNRQRNTLSGIFKYALQQGYISSNPLAKISRLKDNNAIVRYLSDNECTRLLSACKESEWPRLYLLVLMAMTTGMRSSELINLRWSDIDFAESLAFLDITKNGDPRVCPIPSHTMIELKKFRELGEGYIFPSALKPDQPFVFKKHWLKAKELAKVENFRFHDLRHDYCSQLAMYGAGLHEIAELAGHKDLATTKRYAVLMMSFYKPANSTKALHVS